MANYKSDEVLDRLVKILNLLNENEEFTLKELTKKMGTGFNEKTIERDLTERLISFPVKREKMKWKLYDGFRFENDKSIEDAVMLDMIEKMMKSGGPNFYNKGKKFFNTPNSFDSVLDLEDIADQPKEVQKLESCNKDFKFFLMDEIIAANDKLIESLLKIKFYFDKNSCAHLKRTDDSNFYLGSVDGDQYVVMNKDINYLHRYNSIEEFIEDGWVISTELFVKYSSSLRNS